MKQKTGRKLLSFLLTLAMLVGLMPGMGLTAYASQIDVKYLDASGSMQTTSATPVTNSDTTWSTGWYVVNSILTNENRITVNGTVNLILCDGAKLTANAGIAVENDNTLNIYEGWTGERDTTPTVGELSATGGDEAAGIGSKPSDDDLGSMPTAVTGGNIIINGGTVTATGASGAAGIGGGFSCSGGNVTINGGTVTATGGKTAYGESIGMGIGKGYKYSDDLSNGTLTLGTGIKLETSSDNTNWTDTTSTPATRTRYMKTTITAPTHTHSFTYSISGATITAKCNAEDCTLTDVGGNHTATLTIAAPANLTYDGSAKAAVITDENHIQGTTKVQYRTKNGDSYGTATETAPTDPGTYKASITLGEATASVEYTITATPLSITGATLTSRAYAKDNKSVDVTAVTFSGGTPTIRTDYTATAEMADDTAGEGKAVTVTVTLINQNYSLATNTFDTTVNISKAKPAKPAAPTASNITDTGVALTATNGYQYKMNDNGWQDSNEFTGLTEDTSYRFYQRVKGDANHLDSDSSDALTIKTKQEPISYAEYSRSGNFIIITIRS